MRRWQKALLIVLLLLSTLLSGAYWFLQTTIKALPISELSYQIEALRWHRLQLKQVQFYATEIGADITIADLKVSWEFGRGFKPKITHVMLNQGSIALDSWPTAEDNNRTNASLALPGNWQLPNNLPEVLQINDLHFSLPCPATRCDYVANVNAQFRDDKLSADIQLADLGSKAIPRLQISAAYQTTQQLPELALDINLENHSRLRLQQKLEQNMHAHGELDLLLAPPSDWLLQQLQKWQIAMPEQALAQFNAPVTLDSQWQFALPDELTISALSQHADGQIQLRGHLPAPLTVPNVGQLQGDITAELAMRQGEISQYRLNAELELLQPQLPESLRQYGLNSDKLTISVNTDGKQKPLLTALPLHIALQSAGKTTATFSTNATINLTPPLSAALKNSKLALQQPHLSVNESLSLQTLSLHSAFDAYWLADSWQLMLEHANLTIATLSQGQNQLKQLDVALDAGQLSGDSQFTTLKLHNALRVSADKILHPSLKPLSWQWQGKLTGDLNALTVSGKLSNSADLTAAHQLIYQPTQLELSWQLQELFLLAGNPLQASFTDWPPLLEFNRGRINASGSFQWTDTVALKAELSLSGVSGIFDRSIFKDLTAPLSLQYRGDDIAITTTQTKIAEIQHGLTAGPLLLHASYSAKANTPGAGKLSISTLDLQLMGGKVSMDPITLDLAMEQQEVILQLQRIDLAQLLQQHPTTDLSGNGRISGRVPVQISRSGINVDKGLIAAESPGGVLQYRPPAAQSMASGNQGMKVVLDALNDFHYSVLSSDVSYNNDGQLTLALRLQGQNPALEDGRPINLNINLEEDIPALLTSLQLSSQISDKIKQRVQQHLQQNGAKRTNGAKP